MSQEIDTTSPLIRPSNLPNLQKTVLETKQQTDKKTTPELQKPADKLQEGGFLRSILGELSAGREYNDDKSFKNFTRLTRSLEKFFTAADKVDREEGEKELKQGGLRRVDHDLRKLFKGLGMPSQQAKHFSRAMTDAMGQEGVEQINFSLTSSQAFQMELQQKQSAYLATGDGNAIAAEVSNSFQLSAIQVRSLDLSLNLRTGDFSLTRTRFESISISQSRSATLLSVAPSAETSAAKSQPTADGQPVSEPSEITAMIQNDSTLLEISRIVKQSAIMQLTPTASDNDDDEAEEELFADGLNSLQQLVESLQRLTEQSGSIFESLVKISNLRVEHEDDDEHLRFTLDAQAPVGLTAVDETGHGATLYPRPDGSLGQLIEETLKVTV